MIFNNFSLKKINTDEQLFDFVILFFTLLFDEKKVKQIGIYLK